MIWKETILIQRTAKEIMIPIRVRRTSLSKRPMAIRKMLKAGIKFEKGMGRGSERMVAEKMTKIEQTMCEILVPIIGCFKKDITLKMLTIFTEAL